MADTVGNMINRVLRRTLQVANKTAASDADDTQLILDILNEAHELLRDLMPTTLDLDATFSIPALTRLIALPVSGLDSYDIYDWSWQYTDVNGHKQPLKLVTVQFIYETFPDFSTDTGGTPEFVYFDNNQIAVYPMLAAGSVTLTGNFKYSALITRAITWASTFPYPDDWLLWMERYAQHFYEVLKGLGNPPATAAVMEVLYGRIFGKTKKARRIRLQGYRRINNARSRSNPDVR